VSRREEIRNGLEASSRSIRLLTLESLLSDPVEPSLVALVESYRDGEADEECRHFADLVLAHWRGLASAPAFSADWDEKPWLEVFAALPEEKKRAWISRVTPAQAGRVAADIVPLLRTEADPILTAMLVRTFGPHLPAADRGDLVAMLLDPRFHVRVSALEILGRCAPALLLQHLPTLLATPDPWIRALALRGLFAVDPDEAVAHLEGMLLGPDGAARELAIRSCFQVPFDLVKVSLLKALAVEHDPERLRKIGLLFVSNPDRGVPHQIWILAEQAESARAVFLKDLLQKTLRAMVKAGLLDETAAAAFRENLQHWIHQRAGRLFWRQAYDRWQEAASGPGGVEGVRVADPALEGTILAAADQPELLAGFQGPAGLELPLEFRTWVEALLIIGVQPPAAGMASAEPAEEPTGSPAPVGPEREARTPGGPVQGPAPAGEPPKLDFSELSLDERIRTVARWPQDDREGFLALARSLLERADSANDLLATVLRTAIRLGASGLDDAALSLLQTSSTSNLLSAGLDYLAAFAPDSVFPHLGTFLRSPDKQVKIAAVRILRRFDPEQAVSRLRLLLKSTDQKLLEAALACLIHVDFLLVREILVEFLDGAPPRPLFEAGLFLFRSNPDPGNPAVLLALEQRLVGVTADMAKAARLECQHFLVANGIWSKDDLPALEAKTTAAAGAIQARRLKPKPAYAYRPPPAEPSWFRQLTDQVREQARTRFAWAAVGVIGLAICLALFWLFFTDRDSARSGTGGGALVLARETTIEGWVKTGESGWMIIETDRKTRFLFRPADDGFRAPQAGIRVEARVVPYRVQENGDTLCRVKNLMPLLH
jgi:HEAT repeat protein